MTSAEVNLLRAEIVARLEKIELGLFGEDGRGGLAALVQEHLAEHRIADAAREAHMADVAGRFGWFKRIARTVREYWPLILVFLGMLAVILDFLINHLVITVVE